jgi:hypothetical protein
MNIQISPSIFNNDAITKILAYVRKKYPELENHEIDRFMDAVVEFGLDPRQGHMYPFASYRDGVRIIEPTTTNQGMRVKAERSGIYLPDDLEPVVERSPEAVSADNPQGIVKAVVRVRKFAHDDWHYVVGSAYFSDFGYLLSKGKRDYNNWIRQPFNMIIARAEAQALRRAFPDLLSIYTREEMEDHIDSPPERRDPPPREPDPEKPARATKAKPTTDAFVDWKDGNGLQPIATENFGIEAEKFLIANKDDPALILAWRDDRVNKELREHWWRLNKQTEIAKRLVSRLSEAVDAVNAAKKTRVRTKQTEPA